jgi:predicted amidohydrolase YtcJ
VRTVFFNGPIWTGTAAAPTWVAMAVAVTRATADAPQPFLPDQALTPSEALTAFTAGSAWVNHGDRRAGTIEAGKDADFVIASDNPITAPDLSRVRAEATFIGGRIVDRR